MATLAQLLPRDQFLRLTDEQIDSIWFALEDELLKDKATSDLMRHHLTSLVPQVHGSPGGGGHGHP